MAGAGPGNPTPAETSSLLQGHMARRFQGGPEGLTAHLAAGSQALDGCHLVKFTPREGGHDCPYTNWGTMLAWEVSSLSWPAPIMAQSLLCPLSSCRAGRPMLCRHCSIKAASGLDPRAGT